MHKIACKCPLGKPNWRPAWERENRNPFMTDTSPTSAGHNLYGGGHYLLGNTPALDVLCLEKNEGVMYDKDIYLLFAGQSVRKEEPIHLLPFI